ncbi:hypothetical protein ABE28_021395 [Peribacillus muralis]|uniref:ABC3 transporter permease protein domain-containing protein n=1 Tax=Peribacillus muralis TaxID=264697 RepID=A0A1B3XUN1_9BACI|nr:ABC transporter permease [Peribacillus muralis]AOH56908.1 hypothetical protein ABE28_021395 [Peribacillus muralis]
MINLAVKILLARLKWFLLIVVSLGITLACIISLMTSSEAIKTSLQSNAYNNYGEHSGVLIDVNVSKTALQSQGFEAGEYQLIDKLQVNKTLTATIGWMDNDAFKIGHINMKKGKLPTNENEVSIESFYLEKIDPTWKLGDKRKLLIKNKVTQVKLVGIVENYSAKWTVPSDIEKGLNDFPSIFVAKSSLKNTKNFLIRLHKEDIKEMSKLLETYNDNGILNEKLFDKGLKQYDNISKLTVTFQIVILIAASFCFWGLFYYFNLFQVQKDAQLKVLGCSNLKLYKLHLFQCVIIFLLSILVSIPLNIVFHNLIIKNAFFEGDLYLLQLNDIIIRAIVWVVIIFAIVAVISTKSISKFNKKSINNLLNNSNFNGNSRNSLINKCSSFYIRQLAIQFLQFPKQSFLIIFTLFLCIQTIFFSFFLQKESEGIWDAKQDYYIDSQEIFGYEDIQNLNVLVNNGLTFPIEEVNKLEQTKGIKYVDKNPFMVDVHPLINPQLVTPSIESWIKQNGSLNTLYKQDNIIPNVSYQLVDSEEFSEIFQSNKYESFKGKILLIVPQAPNNNKLIGEKLGFVKMYRESGQLKTKKWEFEVFDVIESAESDINNTFLDEAEFEFTIVLDKETAIESGIFTGYKDLTIYMDEDVSKKAEEVIDSLVYEMVVPIPGSLYQKISLTKIEDTRISKYMGYIGNFSFLISLFLSTIGIISILLSKYYMKKRTWGIYLSLGMKRNSIIKLLSFEIFIYYFISIMLSTIIFFLTMRVINHIYPTTFYLVYYMFALIFIFLMAAIGVFALSIIIKRQSIISLLRLDE